jgi:putative Holliday junction resolvase
MDSGTGSNAMSAVMAIDFGTKRLGVAVTDSERRFVLPRDTIQRQILALDLERLRELCKDDLVHEIALGLPLNADGSEGPMAAAARAFGVAVGNATGLKVWMVDERYTSEEAEERLRERYPRDTRRRRALRDRGAAVLILRTFLDHGPIKD